MLGLVVALPVTLAVFFLMVLAWVGQQTALWILVPPLAIVGAALTIFGVRALRPLLATVRSLAVLGGLELVVGVFLLVASRPITGGTIVGAVISFVAAAVAFWAAVRAHATRNQPAASVPARSRRSGPISISVRRPAAAASSGKSDVQDAGARNKRKK